MHVYTAVLMKEMGSRVENGELETGVLEIGPLMIDGVDKASLPGLSTLQYNQPFSCHYNTILPLSHLPSCSSSPDLIHTFSCSFYHT